MYQLRLAAMRRVKRNRLGIWVRYISEGRNLKTSRLDR